MNNDTEWRDLLRVFLWIAVGEIFFLVAVGIKWGIQ